ncbi:non-ribosomal peptide synthetase [Micromonospora sp. KC723]|uniref:non-ribosomal peptide synthetase n=1 Tax=Micromonospora sp. KC723 TaxID=2530381 RepID=UPI00104E1E32|nr:non-ribosomal peptide synthetase [Micromonospora sp. KC723]TDB76023.1 amino acid adenylation domain-containing protein [Micromonospora sp. KC723]
MSTVDDLRRLVFELLGGDTTPGDDDHLIALGLDSLKLMRIAGLLRQRGVRVSFADLIATPTLGAWSALLATATPPGRPTTTERPGPATVTEGEPFPLAPMQHAYWVGREATQQLGAVAAHLYTEFDGHGVDPARLGVALATLAGHHHMLRARILDDGRQVVEPWRHGTELPVLDLRDAAPDEVAAVTAALRERMSHQLLPVDQGRMLDVRVTLLPEGRTRVHVDIDMLAADARSYRMLLADLVRLYEHPERPLPALDYQYAQYLADRRAEPPRPADVRWWQERLADLPGAPELPARPDNRRTDPHRVVRLHRWLDPRTRAGLVRQARRHAVTPAVAVATAFAEVLGAWSGVPRFLLNVPMFDRQPIHPDVERLVGDFTSSVLLPVDVSQPVEFAERAQDVQQSMHDAVAHSSYPGLDVLRDLSREHGTQVLAPVVFTSALDLGELFGAEVEGVLGEPVHIISQGPQVVLDAQVTELHGGLLVNWDVRADALPDGVADAMFAAFGDLLGRVADGTAWDEPVGDLRPAACRSVREQVNATAGPVPEHPLHHAFFARAGREPGRPAVVGAAGTVLTYGQLADAALRLARTLTDRGVRPGDAVAVRLPKGPEQVVAVLGVLAAGAHYVPIGVEQPAARVHRIRQRAGVTAVVAEAPAGDDEIGYASAVAADHPAPAPVLADPTDVAYVLFTSGSTGEPKGVEVSHRAAANTVDDLVERLGLGADDRTLALSALDFDLSVFDLFAPLSVGGAVVVVDEATRRDATAWATLVRDRAVTVLNCVPSLLDMLLTAGRTEPLGGSLRAVLLGGDWVGTDLPRRLHAQVPGCRFLALGGTTETAIHSTVQEVHGGLVPEGWTSVPYGTPLRNVQCRVVDPQRRDCPDWVPGELWIGGAGVADGYRADEDRTADRFVTVGDVRWYRTGDRARYWPDGTIEFLGRADDQVKIRGFRIELGEVEAALSDHPGVRQAVALVLRGLGAPRLAAVAVASAVSAVDLAAHAALRLPPHMVPDPLVVTSELPLTPNGKVDRKALTALAEARPVDGTRVLPETPLQQLVAHVWAQALRSGPVGLHDDYFQLGGDSVLATAITARLRAALDTDDVRVHDVLGSLTVARLADALLRRAADPAVLTATAEIYLEVEALTEEQLTAELGDRSGVPHG